MQICALNIGTIIIQSIAKMLALMLHININNLLIVASRHDKTIVTFFSEKTNIFYPQFYNSSEAAALGCKVWERYVENKDSIDTLKQSSMVFIENIGGRYKIPLS